MKDNSNKMSVAEIELSKLGFYLLEQSVIKIDDKTSYPVIKYARFLDNDKTGYDMVITFDPSQYCVGLEQINSTTVFIEPPLLEAIQARMNELDMVSTDPKNEIDTETQN